MNKTKLNKPQKKEYKLVQAYVTVEGAGSKCTNDRCDGSC